MFDRIFLSRMLKRSRGKKIFLGQNGTVLIVVLLVLLILLILALVLLVQTDSEYLIALNEQDSFQAFFFAEAALDWSKRRIKDAANESTFRDFSELLNGPDNASDVDDHLLGLRNIDATLTETSDLNFSNERTQSVIVTRDFGSGPPETYEAFRMGIDEDGDNDWDGPRALIYVRIDDNYDEFPNTNAPQVDTDKDIFCTSVAEFPIQVDENGVQVMGVRTLSRRHLLARFGINAVQPAILTRRSSLIQGNASVCGECGSVHANQNIYGGGDIKVCKDLTASEYPIQFDPEGAVIGDEFGGGFDEIPVPVINPYDDRMVPEPSDFNGSSYNCDSSTPKYFAFVANEDRGVIFKGIWTTSDRPDRQPGGGWKWKLIDDLSDNNNTVLDDCGRVVCGTVGGVSVHEVGNGICDPGEEWVDDGKNDEFYGFKQTDPFTSTFLCSGDATLSGSSSLQNNDFNTPNFYCSVPNPFCASDNTLYGQQFRMLPGSFDKDGIRDFSDDTFEGGKSRFNFGGNLTYSPVFNAVIWIYGSLNISGNPGDADAKICNSTSSGVLNQKCNESESQLLSWVGGYWKVSFITVGSIQISGNPKYSTASLDFPFLLVAGRDIEISGNPSMSETICRPNDGECAVSAANRAEFDGIVAAHEQIKMNGNFSFNGFVIIEDAVDCTTEIAKREDSTGNPLDWSGNPNIHYDCEHPRNPWSSKVRMTSWSEMNEVP